MHTQGMSLTNEDKARIEAEERYRVQMRLEAEHAALQAPDQGFNDAEAAREILLFGGRVGAVLVGIAALYFTITGSGLGASILALTLVGMGFAVPAFRKTIGMILVIFGTLACLTLIGAIIGVPMLIVGGILVFV